MACLSVAARKFLLQDETSCSAAFKPNASVSAVLATGEHDAAAAFASRPRIATH